MESFIRSPDPLKDNNPKTWIIWKEEFLIFMSLIGYTKRSESYKANLLKNLIGSVGLETINKLSFDNPLEKEDLDILIKKLDNYYCPRKTEAELRYKFFVNVMKNDETIENYIQRLKEQAKDCNFGTLTDSLIRDAVILNTHDKILRKKYLQEETLECDKIIRIYKNHQMREQEKKPKNLNIISKNFKVENKKKVSRAGSPNMTKVPCQVASGSGTSTKNICWKCNTRHLLKQCPAFNNLCMKCNTLHHFENCCRNPSQNVGNLPMNNLNLNHEKYEKKSKVLYNVNKNL